MIVFPMAGLSSRFTKAGYTLPKYMLEAGGKTMFRHVVDGFSEYFDTTEFLFIYRDIADTHAFLESECTAMGLSSPRLTALNEPTRGQAETVQLGLTQADVKAEQPLTIFNIDTLRPHFRYPEDPEVRDGDGYLEVFRGTGDNWSFVRPQTPDSTRVIETTEKNPISDLCCTGLYHFAETRFFSDAFAAELTSGPSQAGEFYVAPLYNQLIAQGLDIRYELIDREAVIFAGTPDEYDDLKKAIET